MLAIAVGVDLGQKRDPTAIAVVEAQRRDHQGRSEEYYMTRFLERLPLGTPYPDVAQRVQAIVGNIRRQVATSEPPRFGMPPPSATIRLYVDGTGGGQPVVDLLKGAGVPVRPVYFTRGSLNFPRAGPARHESCSRIDVRRRAIHHQSAREAAELHDGPRTE